MRDHAQPFIIRWRRRVHGILQFSDAQLPCFQQCCDEHIIQLRRWRHIRQRHRNQHDNRAQQFPWRWRGRERQLVHRAAELHRVGQRAGRGGQQHQREQRELLVLCRGGRLSRNGDDPSGWVDPAAVHQSIPCCRCIGQHRQRGLALASRFSLHKQRQ